MLYSKGRTLADFTLRLAAQFFAFLKGSCFVGCWGEKWGKTKNKNKKLLLVLAFCLLSRRGGCRAMDPPLDHDLPAATGVEMLQFAASRQLSSSIRKMTLERKANAGKFTIS